MSSLTGYERFKGVQHQVERGASVTAAAIILIMGLLTTADVALRYIFNAPLPGTILLMEFMMIAVVFLGVAYVQSYDGHVKMDMLVNKLPPRTGLWFDLVIHILALAIFSLIAWEASAVAYNSWVYQDYASGILPAPYWPARAVLPIGIGLLCLRFVFDIIDDILKFKRVYPLTQKESGIH